MIGAWCLLVGTDLRGLVVGRRTYLGEMDKFAVRYRDAAGSPQERWFSESEVSFDGREVDA